MMLAYGRAIAAVIALVTVIVGDEAKAVAFVDSAGMKELPKRVQKIAKGKLSRQIFDELSTSLTNLKGIAEKRNQLIHGEWWFNVFKGGRLTIRGVRAGKKGATIKHLGTVSSDSLDQWAKQLDEIADSFDGIEYHLSARA
jgi:hypothetical protein